MRIDVPLSKQELSREVSMKGKSDADEAIISLSATAALIIDRKKRRSIRIAHRIVLQFPARDDRAIVDNRTIASSLSAAPKRRRKVREDSKRNTHSDCETFADN